MAQVIWSGALHQTLMLILRGKSNNQDLSNIVYKGATYDIYRDNGRVGFVPVGSGVNDGAYGATSFAGTLASGNTPDNIVEPVVNEIPTPEEAPAPEEAPTPEKAPTPAKKSTTKK